MISKRISNGIPPQMKILNMVIPILQFRFELERCKPRKAIRHPRCDVINDLKQFPTVYHRIYCHKFLKLSNQMSPYKSKFIKMSYLLSMTAYVLMITL